MKCLEKESSARYATAADRQTIIRHLVDRVVVDVQGESERVDVAVHWSGGFISQHEVIRPVASYEQLSGFKELMVRVEEVRRRDQTSAQIAAQLNSDGFHPPGSSKFNATAIRRLLSRNGLLQDCAPPRWRPRDLAEKLGMPIGTLVSWVRRDWLHGKQLEGARGRWVLWADEEELNRLVRLRRQRQKSPGLPAPAELTTPKRRTEN